MSSTINPTADTEYLPLKLLHVVAMGFLSEDDDVAKPCRAALLTGGGPMARSLRRLAQQPDISDGDRRKIEAIACWLERERPLNSCLDVKQVTRALFACIAASDSFLHEEATRLLAVVHPDGFADHLVDDAFTTKSPRKCERLLAAAGTARRPLSWKARCDLQIMLGFKRGRALTAARALLVLDNEWRGLGERAGVYYTNTLSQKG